MLSIVTKNYSPNSGPQTRGIISKVALQDESSKHNCRANKQFKIDIGVFISDPATKKLSFSLI